MNQFPEFINLSDDDEDDHDIDASIGAHDRHLIPDNGEAVGDVGALGATHHNAVNNSAQIIAGGFGSCLHEVLDVFPDISHDHVEQLYRKIIANNPQSQQNAQVAPALIEAILDDNTYPKEKDRIKELKRKRSDGNADEIEAAKWKQSEMPYEPAQYAKVAYVYPPSVSNSQRMFLTSLSVTPFG